MHGGLRAGAGRAGQGKHTDLVLGFPVEFALGYALSSTEQHFGPNPAAFGHDGFGGSAVCADPSPAWRSPT